MTAKTRRISERTYIALIVAVAALTTILGVFLGSRGGITAEQNQDNQINACQRGNIRWRIINQNLVRPLIDVVSIAATPSGDPAFDVFVPRYQKALDAIKTVPYSNCRNLYPEDGSPAVRPYYREAPLPPKKHVHPPQGE